MIQVSKIAKLARLKLSDEEQKLFEPQLNSVFKYFEEISMVDTSNVDPLVTPVDIELHYREDQKDNECTPDEALANAPERSGNLFKVPPVV